MNGEMTTKYTSANDAKTVCAAVKGSTQKTLVSTLSASSATVNTCGATTRRARALQAGEVSSSRTTPPFSRLRLVLLPQ